MSTIDRCWSAGPRHLLKYLFPVLIRSRSGEGGAMSASWVAVLVVVGTAVGFSLGLVAHLLHTGRRSRETNGSEAPGSGPTDKAGRRPSTLFWRWVMTNSNLATMTAALTAVTAIAYVGLAALYGHFYQRLHTRPEEVGLDRVAILTRTFWLVVSALLLVLVLLLVSDVLPIIGDRWRVTTVATNGWVGVVVVTGALIVGFLLGLQDVEGGARAGLHGEPVAPINLFGIPAVDISATPAQVKWVENAKEEPLLNDPRLLYLGRNDKVAVFIVCGQTVIVPESKVEVITRKAGSQGSESKCSGA